MSITLIETSLIPPSERRGAVLAHSAITIDDWLIIRNFRVIESQNGLIVECPSEPLCYRCPDCSHRVAFVDRFCHDCGCNLEGGPQPPKSVKTGKPKTFASIAHPINPQGRELLTREVIAAYQEAVRRQRDPVHFKPTTPRMTPEIRR